MLKYNLVSVGDEASLTLFVSGEMYVAQSTHPNFKAIVSGVMEGDESVVALFDVANTVSKRFERLSERVSVAHGRVYFDNEEVNDSLTAQIVRCLNEGTEDFMPLVNFFEKVATNPSQHSREQFYAWLQRHEFTITTNGDVLMYKGVKRNGDDLVAIHHGPAIVDGEAVPGPVPNNPGSIVEMARGRVAADSAVGCSVGLHAGTYEYASGFGPVVLAVHVNPRDVVSVPTDCNAQKVRTCRYFVEKIVEERNTAPVYDYDDGYDPDDDDYCDACDAYYGGGDCDC